VRRPATLAIAIAAAGLLYQVAVRLSPLDHTMLGYQFVLSAAYFYFLGVSAYKAYAWLARLPGDAKLPQRLARLEPAILVAAAIAALLAWNLTPGSNLSMALILAGVLPLLFRRTRRNALDRKVGELSYGVYLVHFPLYLVVRNSVSEGLVLPLTIALALALAILLYLAVEAPIDRWRQRRAALAARAVAPRAQAATAPAE
jgi:peptidoglycan/LPS O-acetylase OafA/YrhL